LSETVRKRLSEHLPANASLVNPVDLVGDADASRYSDALHTIGSDCADALLAILTPQAATDAASVARTIAGSTRGWPIPVLAAFVGGARVAPGVRVLEEAGIPSYSFPEPAVKTLAGMSRLAEGRARARKRAEKAIDPEVARRWLTTLDPCSSRLGMPELAPLLSAYGIRCVEGRVARDADEAGIFAERIGLPVALKVVSRDITHKTEVGGVALGLGSVAAVREGAALMLHGVASRRPDATIDGILVEAMAPAGKELLLGGVRDAQFGPMVMIGSGGVYVEIFADTVARLGLVSPAEALEMVSELRMAALLNGTRGEPGVDRDALAGVISRFSQILVDVPELAEIEINPLIVNPNTAIAVDARARRSGEE
jgi:acetyltransferase